ncbi:heme ABC transporter ATP-binding protein [Fulvimarina sp. MAC8]|uniref:heme ABC transporter ATP-binding protein n=1 Tax=Fulvimarina sp. MAC8 TaxID=3162874 RepID=UPI0032ED515F
MSVRAGGATILGPLTTQFASGTMVSLVGPNGAGKSTLVKAISGERDLQSGIIRLHGEDVRTVAPHELARRRAVLPQASAISFPFTVFEIIGLGLRQRRGIAAAERQIHISNALDAVDLEGFGGRLYQQLSGGEQQRVQLARILCQIGDPLDDGPAKLLILDEPTSSLDVRHQLDVLSIARSFADRGGLVIAVLHDLNLAATFSDRMLLMRSGMIVEDDSPAALLQSHTIDEVFGIAMARVDRGEGHLPVLVPEAARSQTLTA